MEITEYSDFSANYIVQDGMIGSAENLNKAPIQLKKELDNLYGISTKTFVQEEEPTDIKQGDNWYQPSTGSLFTRVNDGGSDIWIDVTASTGSYNQETEPEEPEIGDNWYVPSTGALYKRVADENGNEVWVSVNFNSLYTIEAEQTVFTNEPSEPKLGNVWITDNGSIFIWSGSQWVDITEKTIIRKTVFVGNDDIPEEPQVGDRWFKDSKAYVYGEDNEWSEISVGERNKYYTIQPSDAVLGDLWFEGNLVHSYNGSNWVTLNPVPRETYYTVAPESPEKGDRLVENNIVKLYDGSKWIELNPTPRQTIFATDSEPNNPELGDRWFNGSTIYAYNGSEWIDMIPVPRETVFRGTTQPTTPQVGDTWFNGDKIYIFNDNEEWFELTDTNSSLVYTMAYEG